MARQQVRITRKVDIEKKYINLLNLELDYELLTLHDAIQQDDENQKVKSKIRLSEIHKELTKLGGLK